MATLYEIPALGYIQPLLETRVYTRFPRSESRIRLDDLSRLLGASGPLERKGLCERCVHRVGSDITGSRPIGSIANLKCAVNVEDSVGTARSLDGGSQVECITIGVVGTIDGTSQYGVSGSLDELALEVVKGSLGSSDLFVELIVATIIHGCKSERETTWNVNAKGNLAVPAVLSDGDSWASIGIEVTKGDGHGSVVGAEDIVSRSCWAARAVDTNAGDVETGRRSDYLTREHNAEGCICDIARKIARWNKSSIVGWSSPRTNGKSKQEGNALEHCGI